jgi:hypothetical protein
MTVSFLTPLAALSALAVLIPIVALWLNERRGGRVCRTLGLEPPARASRLPALAAAVLAFGLLGAAAAQPVVRTTDSVPVRTDAEVFVLFDITRSMLASSSPSEPDRFERAVEFSLGLRAAFPDVQVGAGSITNRLLPNLFPTSDEEAFNAVVERVIGVDRPPPALDLFRRSTSFEALEGLATDNLFAASSIRRLAVLLSDGETQLFAPASLARKLEARGVELIVVRFWSEGERIWLADGQLDPVYRTIPQAQEWVRDLGALTIGRRVFDEDELAAVIDTARAYLGNGPTSKATTNSRGAPIALYLVLAAALPLSYLLARGRGEGLGWPALLHTVWSLPWRGSSRTAGHLSRRAQARSRPSSFARQSSTGGSNRADG